MKTPLISKLSEDKFLKEEGLALEYYPKYVNRKRNLHSVDVVLLSFIMKGTGVHYLGDKSYPEKGRSLSITHFGQVHDIVTDDDGMEIMNIYLNFERYRLPNIPEELQNVLHQILPLHPNFYLTPGHMTRIEFAAGTPVALIVKNMYHEFKTRKPGWRDLLNTYFRIFLSECCRESMQSGLTILGQGSSVSPHIMEPVRQFLDAHYAEHIPIETLAKKAGYSNTYLCRLFKEYTGKSVYDYLLDKRVQIAMNSLRLTQNKISYIAIESGFQDLSFFNKVFKRKLGLSPRDYRISCKQRVEL
ncbi:MAG: helix-turn-helix transcriptional regulator [Fibrobacteres bacterium]|nr:helix-turn-helix transcriptional regulator [Fibrobacterota bacterium]